MAKELIKLDDLVDEVVASVNQLILARQDYQKDCLSIFHTLGMNICGHSAYQKGAHGQGMLFENLTNAVAEKLNRRVVSADYLRASAHFYELYPELRTAVRTLEKQELPLTIGAVRTHLLPPSSTAERIEPPQGKYRVILADPPWFYSQDQHSKKAQRTTIGTHYPPMSTTAICRLPVKNLAEDNAVLFLWVTSPKLYEAKPVIDAWGFEYKTSMVWDKVKHNVGYYVSVRHEFLLICTRGSCLPDSGKLVDSVVSIERTRHSEKPERFYEIIEQMYKGKKIELFARKKRPGWDQWGLDLLKI